MPAILSEPAVRAKVRVRAKPSEKAKRAKHASAQDVLRFRCPTCEQAVRARPSAAGKRGRCPVCRGALVFPRLDGAPAPTRCGKRESTTEAQSEKPLRPKAAAWPWVAIFLAGLVLGTAGGRWTGQPPAELQVAAHPSNASMPAPARAEVLREVPRPRAAETEEPQLKVPLEADLLPKENPFLSMGAPEPDRTFASQSEAVLVEPAAPVLGYAEDEEEPGWREPIEQSLPVLPSRTHAEALPLAEESVHESAAAAPLVADAPPEAAIPEEREPVANESEAARADFSVEAARSVPVQSAKDISDLPQSKAPPWIAPPPATQSDQPARSGPTGNAEARKSVAGDLGARQFVAGPEACREATSGEEVYQRFKDRYHGIDSKMDLRLILINERGEQRCRHLLRYRRRRDGLTSTLFFFVAPSDVKGTATLTVEQEEGDDLQRIYLPALRKHRRIASLDKGKSWLGSDLAYEDLQERRPSDFRYSKLDTQSIDGHVCYHFTMAPQKEGASSYGHLEYWIRKDNHEMIRGRYYDQKGTCIKSMRMGQYHVTTEPGTGKTIQTATWMVMYNYEDKHRTLLITDRAQYNVGLKDEQFSPRYLEKLPSPFDGGESYRTRLADCMFVPDPQSGGAPKP